VSYVRGTLAVLVDSVVPETPELAEPGEEHVPGGLEAGLDELFHERVNRLQEADGGRWGALGTTRCRSDRPWPRCSTSRRWN
jgi:hypothetical protein